MCGIFAAYTENPHINVNTFSDVANMLVHRGPDETTQSFVSPKLFMSFSRLAVNGLNTESSQPFENDDCIVICNGEIYNYMTLATKYNIKLETSSDCEVLMHLYSEFGNMDFLKQLDAEFALILYDKKRDILYAARDHIGIRPLFVGIVDKYTTLFSSEAKPLIKHCKSIRQFLPGHVSTSKHCLTMETIYDDYMLCTDKEFRNHTREEVQKNLHDILIKSVKDRLISDRPIGAFLSGGLDSSIIVAILARFVKDLHTFTIGFKGSPDIEAAKKVAKYLGIEENHHIVYYTPDEGIEALNEVIKSLESYDITTIRASTPQWLLSKYIKKYTDIRVLFSGECIDEVCGYFFLSFCKDDETFNHYTRDMLKELHLYDLLRTDRTTAAHGLEVRVPFASKAFLNYIMNIKTGYKRFGNGCIEKKLLRDAFQEYLPQEIITRKKHAFSDSVSNSSTSWYKTVSNFACKFTDEERWTKRHELFPYNTPVSKESFLYREIFERYYPNRATWIPHFWMPKGVDENTDPSATVLDGFNE